MSRQIYVDVRDIWRREKKSNESREEEMKTVGVRGIKGQRGRGVGKVRGKKREGEERRKEERRKEERMREEGMRIQRRRKRYKTKEEVWKGLGRDKGRAQRRYIYRGRENVNDKIWRSDRRGREASSRENSKERGEERDDIMQEEMERMWVKMVESIFSDE